ncbi:MAG: YigZ family protein [Clostridiales Family XIII bacterium]|jgi:uncharacterized YigZ family protein|nr:YigZ family protein [Clostridiales Family XIII bacterium]
MSYKTVAKSAIVEQVIEKSRFIAHITYVESKEDADAFFSDVRKEHRSASHNVPAMVLGEKSQIQWASDDGEPQGTSGVPMLQMLVNEGIANVAVIVTRYFGGTKLGTGGLVRAYTNSAKLALKEAGIVEVKEMCVVTYEIDYTYYDKLKSMEESQSWSIDNIEYSDKVCVDIVVDPVETAPLEDSLAMLTAGKAVNKGSVMREVRVIL